VTSLSGQAFRDVLSDCDGADGLGQPCEGMTHQSPIGKMVAALPGDTVVLTTDGITVNGALQSHSRALATDLKGRGLPQLNRRAYVIGAIMSGSSPRLSEEKGGATSLGVDREGSTASSRSTTRAKTLTGRRYAPHRQPFRESGHPARQDAVPRTNGQTPDARIHTLTRGTWAR
jgi:hypothetical protein